MYDTCFIEDIRKYLGETYSIFDKYDDEDDDRWQDSVGIGPGCRGSCYGTQQLPLGLPVMANMGAN